MELFNRPNVSIHHVFGSLDIYTIVFSHCYRMHQQHTAYNSLWDNIYDYMLG